MFSKRIPDTVTWCFRNIYPKHSNIIVHPVLRHSTLSAPSDSTLQYTRRSIRSSTTVHCSIRSSTTVHSVPSKILHHTTVCLNRSPPQYTLPSDSAPQYCPFHIILHDSTLTLPSQYTQSISTPTYQYLHHSALNPQCSVRYYIRVHLIHHNVPNVSSDPPWRHTDRSTTADSRYHSTHSVFHPTLYHNARNPQYT